MSSKILLIGGDKKLESSIKSHIDDHSFDLIHIADPKKAAAKVKSAKPDMIMIDIKSKKFDGWKILANIQGSKTLSKIPVIIVDERHSHKNEILSFENGAAAYASKSTKPELLLQKLYSIQMISDIQSRSRSPIIDVQEV